MAPYNYSNSTRLPPQPDPRGWDPLGEILAAGLLSLLALFLVTSAFSALA